MKKLAYIGAGLFLPLLAFAQISNASDLGNTIIGLINNVAVPVLFAIAFIVFIFGVFRYFIQGASDEEAKENGKSLMLWGLIGFFVMVSVWGLVNIIRGTFNLNNTAATYPTAPYTSNGPY
ncbi:MAG: hypothetical protein KGI41_00155 [Patescibacteria group bacterium]|nr:hypothetical protein [Patescibacteria group bacterium]MDE1965644.1 hypothetical protein [Patescibacteria group bacterium]